MSETLICPTCGSPTAAKVRYCEACGVDLTVAALLVAHPVSLPEFMSTGAPVTPEILVPRIGEYMIERGLLTSEGLQQALHYQAEQSHQGKSLLLGRALLELGLTNQEILDQVVTAQILELQNALHAANSNLKQRVKERTHELQNALERLSELNQLKANFIANISHELRTPLTHIKGYLDLLSESGLGELNPQQKEAIAVMKRSEMRLEHLIEDLIQFTMAARGEFSLTIRPFEITRLLQSIVERFSGRAAAANITLLTDIAHATPKVFADEDKIGWVIQQLLDNAVKFTASGGKVWAKVRQEDYLVNIAVIDSGIGIPEEKLTEIFEPFHQLDGSATRRYAGTGLGLTLARRIVEAHGAQLHVHSSPGKGSCFEFNLPIRPPHPGEA